MKKVILPLLLILAVGILAAVESAPSAVVGYVKYDCVAGNNFIALPMSQGYATTADLGVTFGLDVNTVNIWNPAAQSWDASINYDGFWDPELPVDVGSVLFIAATNPFTFYSLGDLPASPSSYDVIAGNNTVMIPLNRSDLSTTALAGATMGDGLTVNTINLWNSSAQSWDASINYDGFWDPEFDLTIGTPLFISSGSAFTWPSATRQINHMTISK